MKRKLILALVAIGTVSWSYELRSTLAAFLIVAIPLLTLSLIAAAYIWWLAQDE